MRLAIVAAALLCVELAVGSAMTTTGPGVECYRGSQCPTDQYCLCGDDLDGNINCESEGSQCRDLPLGASRNEESWGYVGCTNGAACGDGYFCNCDVVESTGEYDCASTSIPPECTLLSEIDEYHPTANEDGPGYFICTRGDDCAAGEWCDCFTTDDGDWDCSPGVVGSRCTSLDDGMNRVDDGPGYYLCTSGADCDYGEYCDCQGSDDISACFENEPGNSVCINLPVGYVANMDGPGVHACNNGTYSSATPGESGGHSGCSQCSPGTYTPDDNVGYTYCHSAIPGRVPNEAQNKLVLCSPGFFAATSEQSECTACEGGTFTSNYGSTFCNCTEAGYIPNSRATDEVACQPGTFASEDCVSECEVCAAGKYQPLPHNRDCHCAVGGTVPFDNRTGYTYCEAGTFAAGECNSACSRCDPGHYNRDRGNEACFPADSGYYVDEEGPHDNQVPCEPGFYGDEQGLSECKQCQSGRYAAFYHEQYCECAGPGRVASEDQTSAEACEPGYFSTEECSHECLECAAGRYSNLAVNPDCLQCALGEFVDTEAQSECSQCAIGYFAGELGQSQCTECGISMYTTGMGRSVCESCFTLEASMGFGFPDQCIIVWVVLGSIFLIMLLGVFGRCCRPGTLRGPPCHPQQRKVGTARDADDVPTAVVNMELPTMPHQKARRSSYCVEQVESNLQLCDPDQGTHSLNEVVREGKEESPPKPPPRNRVGARLRRHDAPRRGHKNRQRLNRQFTNAASQPGSIVGDDGHNEISGKPQRYNRQLRV